MMSNEANLAPDVFALDWIPLRLRSPSLKTEVWLDKSCHGESHDEHSLLTHSYRNTLDAVLPVSSVSSDLSPHQQLCSLHKYFFSYYKTHSLIHFFKEILQEKSWSQKSSSKLVWLFMCLPVQYWHAECLLCIQRKVPHQSWKHLWVILINRFTARRLLFSAIKG